MKKFTLFLLLSAFCSIILAQSYVERTIIDRNNKGIIQSVQFSKREKTVSIPSSAAAYFKDYLKVNSGIEFKEIPHASKDKEIRHEHFDQYYKGVPVEGAGYNFHYDKGEMFYAHGHYVDINVIDVKPTITAEKARDIFIAHKRIPESLVTDFISNLIIKEISEKGTDNSVAKLVYRIYLLANHSNNNEVGFIDAHTGALLATEPNVMDYSATGTFATRYNGTRQGITQNYNNGFHLADSTRGAIIHTWNLNGSINVNDRVELTDNDNNWTTNEHSNNTDMALDVHWSLQQIYDYLHNHHGINSFNNNSNNGFPITAYIKYGTGQTADNAGWDPTLQVLEFGEGFNRFRPVACLDAVAHEYGHGITQFQIGWGFNQRNFHEGMSDIWAAILEHRINPNSNSFWQIGEQITRNYQCLRNIQNTNDANADTKIANTFGSTQYNNGDIYVQGGVLSHWFYLLVNGGSGVNDIGNSYQVYGVGFDTAEHLIINAVFNNFLDNTTTYQALRTSFVNAANGNSVLIQQIENAWYAVGVGNKPTQLNLSGPSTICDQATYTIENLPPGATVQWSTSNSYLTLLSGQGTATAMFKKIEAWKSDIYANIIFNNTPLYTLELPIVSGAPTLTIINSSSNVTVEHPECCAQVYLNSDYREAYIDLDVVGIGYPSVSDIEVTNLYSDVFQVYRDGRGVSIVGSGGEGFGQFTVRAMNECGYGRSISINVDISNIFFSLFPNPATTTVSINLEEEKNQTATRNAQTMNTIQTQNYQIQLWNSFGLVKQVTTDQNNYQLDLHGIPKGFYYVHVIKDGKTHRKQLIIK